MVDGICSSFFDLTNIERGWTRKKIWPDGIYIRPKYTPRQLMAYCKHGQHFLCQLWQNLFGSRIWLLRRATFSESGLIKPIENLFARFTARPAFCPVHLNFKIVKLMLGGHPFFPFSFIFRILRLVWFQTSVKHFLTPSRLVKIEIVWKLLRRIRQARSDFQLFVQ